jgi:hypothetical protein
MLFFFLAVVVVGCFVCSGGGDGWHHVLLPFTLVCFFFFFPSLRAALQTTEKRIDRACICATILFFTIVCCGFVLFCLFVLWWCVLLL